MLKVRDIFQNPTVFLGCEVKVNKQPAGRILSIRLPPFIENRFEGSESVIVCDGLSPIDVGSSVHISCNLEIEDKNILLLASGIVSLSSLSMLKITESIVTFVVNGEEPIIYPTTVPYDVDMLNDVGLAVPDLDLVL